MLGIHCYSCGAEHKGGDQTTVLCVRREPTVTWLADVREQLKPDGTRWRTGGEVKGKLANGVGSQYPSHRFTLPRNLSVPTITTADAHTSAASSRLNWRPRRFKWTRPFRRKTKSGFCACAIIFQTQSTSVRSWLLPWDMRPKFNGRERRFEAFSTTCVSSSNYISK